VFGDLCESWPVVWCCDLSQLSPPPTGVTGYALEAASEILWEATGRQFGNCPVTVRPCRRNCGAEWPTDLVWADGILASTGYPWPTLLDGVWINLACGRCVGTCDCSFSSEVLFPDPVRIVDVTIDGESLPASGWVLYDGQRLVRTDGEWPLCQDWHVTGGPGAWSVTVQVGSPVPRLGQLAVGVLACEFVKACTLGSDGCDLPNWVLEVVRQGVRIRFGEVARFMEHGFTGLYIPDKFIGTFNPSNIRDRARAYSPDLPLPRLQ
jgi:hypothetical protein